MTFYKRTDALLDALDEVLIDRFNALKTELPTLKDEARIKRIRVLYDEVYALAEEYFYGLAMSVYRDHEGKGKKPTRAWVRAILTEPDPVSKYSFANEMDRRAARLIEAISAEATRITDEVEAAKRSVALAYHIYAVRVTDEAAVTAMKDSGVKKVKWVAEDDTHTCKVCHKRDNEVYPIDDIPPKPHINCRCWLVRVP